MHECTPQLTTPPVDLEPEGNVGNLKNLIRGSGLYEAKKSMKWSSRLRETLFLLPSNFHIFQEFRSRLAEA